MALDSKEKRQAVPSVGRVWARNTFPVATPDEQWRMSVGNSYGGNALSAGLSTIISQARSLSRFVSTRVFGRVN
jgi:hypothetical protein